MTDAVVAARPCGVAQWRAVDAEAPPQRLAMFRILVAGFVVAYLVIRLGVFLELGQRTRGFDPVGPAVLLDGPVAGWVVVTVLATAIIAGVTTALGWRFRASAPVFAVSVLALTSYRSSWGQMLHFENLFVLHLLIVALSPAADTWSLDARAGRVGRAPRAPTAYGWPLALAALVVVVTYMIAGVAKIRYGGVDWLLGDTLRNHIAYSAARLELLGGTASPFAAWAVRNAWLWPFAAVATVVIELGAPVALLGGRARTAWVVGAWAMHAGILAFMLVGFPYPLFGVAFAPFFELERLGRGASRVWASRPRIGK